MNDYPTDKQLEMIESWDWKNPKGLIEFIQSIWNYSDHAIEIRKGRDRIFKKLVWKIELHTIGWSGNEDIIYALKKNFFWTFFWEKSERGGHYYFEIRPEMWK